MVQAKRASRGKRPSKAVAVLGIAGVSLAASTGGSPADVSSAPFATPTAGSVAGAIWQDTAPFHAPSLHEEEISDVSLATFYLFDKEDLASSQSGVQLAAFRGGCGCGHGCGGGGFRGCGGGFRGCGGGCRGCGAGFRGCRGCGVGFGGCGCGGGWGGCGGCGWGWGAGGCCLSWGGCLLC
jgi:hypothetical protein